MRQVIFFIAFLISVQFLSAQNNSVGIGTTTPTTKLTVNGGLSLIPTNHIASQVIPIPDDVSELRIVYVEDFQQNTLSAGISYEGQLLIILNEDDNPAYFAQTTILPNGGVGTFVYIDGSWHSVVTNLNNQWLMTGNALTDPNVNFIGTTDNQPLIFRTNNAISGILNPLLRGVALGRRSYHPNDEGFDNVFIGDSAGSASFHSSFNTFLGSKAGAHASLSGYNNILLGYESGKNTTANSTIAIGYASGLNAGGSQNVFVGQQTGMNTQGGFNAFLGDLAGEQNTLGGSGTLIGSQAGQFNTSGQENTLLGFASGKFGLTGDRNTYVGGLAGLFSIDGSDNAALGYQSGQDNRHGNLNVFLGKNAGSGDSTGIGNVYLGHNSGKDIFGFFTEPVITNAVAIGANTLLAKSNTIVLGHDASVGLGTNNPDHSAILDIKSLQQGVLIPRMVSSDRLAIANPAKGLLVFDNTENAVYFFDGNTWINTLKSPFAWGLSGNAGTNPNLDFIGTTDSPFLKFKVNNVDVGGFNQLNKTIGFGTRIFNNADHSVFIGDSTGYITQGGHNSFVGNRAGRSQVSGGFNSFFGSEAGAQSTGGNFNSFYGYQSGLKNSTGHDNSFFGTFSATNNRHGSYNTFLGQLAGFSNLDGNENIAIGPSLISMQIGDRNITVGNRALEGNTESQNTVAIGYLAGAGGIPNYVSIDNTFIGYKAGANASLGDTLVNAIAIGANTLVQRSNTLILGASNDVGIGTSLPNPSAILDIQSAGKGILIPRMGTPAIESIASPVEGLLAYDNTLHSFSYYNGTEWIPMAADGASNVWGTSGNAGIFPENFIGTTDSPRLTFKLNNQQYGHLNSQDHIIQYGSRITNPINSVIIGDSAAYAASMFASENTIIGNFAGRNLETGFGNTLIGDHAGHHITSSTNNTVIGNVAGINTSNGVSNTFLGNQSGNGNITGDYNTYLGTGTGNNNATGDFNTALGTNASSMRVGSNNIAIGNKALSGGSSGGFTIGDHNIAIGFESGNHWVFADTIGFNNIFIGKNAGGYESNGDTLINATAIGANSLVGKSNSIVLGNTETNVGIGNLYPSYKLDVLGSTKLHGHLIYKSGDPVIGDVLMATSIDGDAEWVDPSTLPIDFVEDDPQVNSGVIDYVPRWSGSSLVDGAIRDNGFETAINSFIISGQTLSVGGKTATDNFKMSNGAANGFVLQSDAVGNATWVNSTSLTVTESDPQVSSSATNKVPRWNGTTLNDGVIQDDATNIGIGTAPVVNQKLTVSGKTTSTNLQMTAGAANGLVLQSDAAGNATWVNSTTLPITESDPQVSSSATNKVPRWNGTTLNDGVIQDDATNIGIGTAPVVNQKLTVSGKTTTTNLQMTTGAANGLVLQSDATGNATWVNSTTLPVTESDPQVSSSATNKVPRWNGSTLADGAIQDDATNIGIGTAPVVNQKLTVSGKTTSTNLQMTAGAANGLVLQSDATGNATWVNSTTLPVTESDPQVSSSATNKVPRWNGTTLNDGVIQDDATNIGIGTAPVVNQKLTISGKTTTTNLQMTTGAATGLVLQSDATGNATWVAPGTLASGTLNQAYDFGGVGNGRTINALNGAVKIQGTDGFLVTGSVGMGSDIEINGPGARMFFNPKKSAFRAGNVVFNSWDADSIGSFSVALGRDTKAKGSEATALGYFTSASGQTSTAMGEYCVALGYTSTAMGSLSAAKGDYSLAMGYQTKAIGDFSTSTGKNSKATGTGSFTAGFHTISKGYYGMAIGVYNDTILTTDQYLIEETTPLFIIGNGNENTSRSNAMVVLKNGNIGMGVSPVTGQKLTVAGKTTTTNLQMTTGAGANRVLQSDASGNATWVNPNTLAINNLYNTSGLLTSARTLTQGSNAFTILNNGAQNTIINLSSTGDFDVQNNGVSSLFVDDAGKTGINMDAPQAGLHIKGIAPSFDAHIRLEATNSSEYANIVFDGDLKFKTFGVASDYQWRNNANNIRMVLQDDGDLGIGVTDPLTSLQVNGGLTLNDLGNVTLTIDNQVVTVGNSSYIRLATNTNVAANRTVVLTDGLEIGQILFIENSETGINSFEFPDTIAGNTNTSGVITMTSTDVIQFIWNGADWLQVSYSNN